MNSNNSKPTKDSENDLRHKIQNSESKSASGASTHKTAKDMLAPIDDRWWLNFNFQNVPSQIIVEKISGSFNKFAKKLNSLKQALGNANARKFVNDVEHEERQRLTRFDKLMSTDKIKKLEDGMNEALKELAAMGTKKEKYKKSYLDLLKRYEELENDLAGEKFYVEKLDRENRVLRRGRDKDEEYIDELERLNRENKDLRRKRESDDDYIMRLKSDYNDEKQNFEKSLMKMVEINKKLGTEKRDLEKEMEILQKQINDQEAEKLGFGQSTSRSKNDDIIALKYNIQALEDERDGLKFRNETLMQKYEDCNCRPDRKSKRKISKHPSSTPKKSKKSTNRDDTEDTGFSNELVLSD